MIAACEALPPETIDYKRFNALAAELEGFAAAINGGRAYPITAGDLVALMEGSGDGFTARAAQPSSAAEHLRHKNRLAVLDGEIAAAEAEALAAAGSGARRCGDQDLGRR